MIATLTSISTLSTAETILAGCLFLALISLSAFVVWTLL